MADDLLARYYPVAWFAIFCLLFPIFCSNARRMFISAMASI